MIKVVRSKKQQILSNAYRVFKVSINEPFDVYEADEAFVTSTPFCLIPAVTLNGIKIGDGKPGPVTKSLLNKWGEIAEVDIVGQIKAWEENAEGVDVPSPYKFATKKKCNSYYGY